MLINCLDLIRFTENIREYMESPSDGKQRLTKMYSLYSEYMSCFPGTCFAVAKAQKLAISHQPVHMLFQVSDWTIICENSISLVEINSCLVTALCGNTTTSDNGQVILLYQLLRAWSGNQKRALSIKIPISGKQGEQWHNISISSDCILGATALFFYMLSRHRESARCTVNEWV